MGQTLCWLVQSWRETKALAQAHREIARMAIALLAEADRREQRLHDQIDALRDELRRYSAQAV